MDIKKFNPFAAIAAIAFLAASAFAPMAHAAPADQGPDQSMISYDAQGWDGDDEEEDDEEDTQQPGW